MLQFTINIECLSYYQYLTQNKFRKYITTKGRKYKNIIEEVLNREMVDKEILKGDIRVELDFYFNNRRNNDIDNYSHPILDFMSKIVYEDDRQIIDLHVKKFYSKDNPRIVIRVDKIVTFC